MTVDQAAARLIRSDGILAVSNVNSAVRYYADVLGFGGEWTWGEPPDFGGVRWGKVNVMFCLQRELAARVAGHQHAFVVEGIDALHALHLRNGAEIIAPLEAKPWGLREYVVRDLNGYHLRFGEPHSEEAPRKAQGQRASFTIVERKPTVLEIISLFEAVGWSNPANRESAPVALKNSLHGAVAVDGERVLGSGLVVGDGVTFFYLKDVIVRPENQGQGIGTAIVESLMAYVRHTGASGALVGLFTPKHLANFYGRFGFLGPDERVNGMCLELQGGPQKQAC
jgi:GNAT superfamily N-acetyltransferase